MKRRIMYYGRIKMHNETKDRLGNSCVIIHTITNKEVDTLYSQEEWLEVKLDSECEYVITSGSKDSLRYIYVGRKKITEGASSIYYNMYLSSVRPVLLNMVFEKCSSDSIQKIKVVDWVNDNEFYISTGPDQSFPFLVTDLRLVSFYLNDKMISPLVKEMESGRYCISLVED